MYRVLVVDDEKWIRKGIVSMIEKNRHDIADIVEAQNAVEAQEIFQSVNPDILVCDVRMPVKDGCTLCEEIIEEYPSTKIIMISGYNEFSYVQRALKYGAADYLLKPINKAELNKVIEKVIGEIEDRKLFQHLTINARLNLEGMLTQFVLYPSSPIAANIEEMIKINIGEFRKYFIILLEFNSEEYESDFFKDAVKGVLSSFKRNEEDFIVVLIRNEYICVVIFENDEAVDELMVVHSLTTGLQSNNILQFFISKSDSYKDMKMMSHAYEEAKSHLDQRKVNSSVYCSGTSQEYSMIPEHYTVLAKSIVAAIEEHNMNKLNSLFDEMQNHLKLEQDIPIRVMKAFFTGLSYNCIELLMNSRTFEKGLLQDGVEVGSHIIDCYDAGQMLKIVREFSQKVAERKEEIAQSDAQMIVKEVIEYVRLNYREQITLNGIAAKYYINSSYFSYMFKKITGESFINYLTRVKVEKATELMKTTNLKVNEIGSLVGYPNSRYFSKVFKKVTGFVPTQYKAECKHENQ